MSRCQVRVAGLSVDYPAPKRQVLRAVDNVSFELNPGERIAIVGPSGCGKSTILSAMAGLVEPTEGEILYEGKTPVEARGERFFSLVPQSPALLQWRTAEGNVALPLKIEGFDRAEVRKRAPKALKLLQLAGFESYRPRQLSGGMQSRVALARAFSIDPRVLLLDECFGSLDELTRDQLNCELSPMWHRLKTSIVLVTHSVQEAVFLADRVLVLSSRPGRVVGVVQVQEKQPRNHAFQWSSRCMELMAEIRSLLGL